MYTYINFYIKKQLNGWLDSDSRDSGSVPVPKISRIREHTVSTGAAVVWPTRQWCSEPFNIGSGV
jgi:hypothetical protein